MPIDYQPYHVHSYSGNIFTQNDSPTSIEDYAKEFNKRGYSALCITEHGNRSDIFAQYDMVQKYDNLKTAIAGAEVYFVPDRNPELKDRRNFHLVLLAKNQEGLYQLNRITSEANETGFYAKARVDFDLLRQLNPANFLCTTACVGGVLKDDDGEKYCKQLYDIFGKNFYLEIQHHPQDIQVKMNQRIVSLYKKHGWPLIYGTDTHYISKEDKILREELLLSGGVKADKYADDSFDLYLPTAEESYAMLKNQGVFSAAQIEEAMENTLLIRDFEGVSFTKERKFPISRKDLSKDERKYLYQKLVCDGYIAKEGMPSADEAAELRKEMNTILETDSEDYFITHVDIIDEAIKRGGVLTTTGRGSASSFATNYALGFSTVNRLHTPVKLYADRFVSKAKLESGSMPDIDMNITNLEAFEEAGKSILGEYGCLPMIAYGKTKTSSAFKMLARARNLDFEISNEISKQLQQYELDVKHAKENNQDDPDYDVDMDVFLDDYIEPKYLDIVNDSIKYRNIIVNISPHPCAHLIYHEDLRKHFGVVRLKNEQYCVYVDGATADAYGWCKSDFNFGVECQ